MGRNRKSRLILLLPFIFTPVAPERAIWGDPTVSFDVKCGYLTLGTTVTGIVAEAEDLANDLTAKRYLQMAKDTAAEKCPSRPSPSVRLYHGHIGNKPYPDVVGYFDSPRDEVRGYENVVAKRREIVAAWNRWQEKGRAIVERAEREAGGAAAFRTPRSRFEPHVIVDVPIKVDLAKQEVADAYLARALAYVVERDKLSYYPGGGWTVRIALYQGGREEVTLTWDKSSGGEYKHPWFFRPLFYRNLVQEQQRLKETARQGAEAREARLRPVRARLQEFMRKHRIEQLLPCSSLSRNPYAMEGKAVAVSAGF